MPLDLEGFNEYAHVTPSPDQDIVDRLRFDDSLDVPWQLTDVDLWNNYCDDRIYELDKRIRAYLKGTRYTREKKGKFKTAAPLVFLHLFGRRAEAADSQVCVDIHKILKYYCTSWAGPTAIKGQRYTKVYYFSKYSVQNKRPYSLRLRLEERNDEHAYRSYGENKDKHKPRRRRDKQDGEPVDGRGGEVGRGKDA